MTGRIAFAVVASIAAAACAPAARAQQQTGAEQPAIDSSWLSSDAAAKSAKFQLVAGLTTLNGALNFNGFDDGGLELVIPVGWKVEMDFVNHDGMLPHSALVVAGTLPIDPAPTQPAIPRAYTVRVAEGIPPGGKDKMNFTADSAGSYFIVCGVPGHAVAGMWIRLRVSKTATKPTMEATPQPTDERGR